MSRIVNETIVQGLINNKAVYDEESGERLPNVDYHYGPYESVDEAYTSLQTEGGLAVGRTVGVKVGETIKEYWLNGGTDKVHLVEKMPAQSGGSVDAYTKAEIEEKLKNTIVATGVDPSGDTWKFTSINYEGTHFNFSLPAASVMSLGGIGEDGSVTVPVSSAGIIKAADILKVYQNEKDIEQLKAANMIDDVPTDDNAYVRKNGGWVNLANSSSVFSNAVLSVTGTTKTDGIEIAVAKANNQASVIKIPYAKVATNAGGTPTYTGGMISAEQLRQIYTNNNAVTSMWNQLNAVEVIANNAVSTLENTNVPGISVGFKLKDSENDVVGAFNVPVAHMDERLGAVGGILLADDYKKLHDLATGYNNYSESGDNSSMKGELTVKGGKTTGGVTIGNDSLTFSGDVPTEFKVTDEGFEIKRGETFESRVSDGLYYASVLKGDKGCAISVSEDEVGMMSTNGSGDENALRIAGHALEFKANNFEFTVNSTLFPGCMCMAYEGSFSPYFMAGTRGFVTSCAAETGEAMFSFGVDGLNMFSKKYSGNGQWNFNVGSEGIIYNGEKLITESTIGNLGDLETKNEHTNIVSAINEVISTKPDMVGENLVDGTAQQFVYNVSSADQNGKNVKTSYNFGSRAYQLKSSSLARVVVKLEGLRKVGSEQLIAIFASNSEGDQCEIFRMGSGSDFSNRTSSNINVPLSFDSSNIEGFAGQTIYMHIKGFSAGKISISDLKVENGTKSTAWCISESDKVANINVADYYTKSDVDGKFLAVNGEEYTRTKDAAYDAKANAEALRSIVGSGINGKTLSDLGKSLKCVEYDETTNDSNATIPTLYSISVSGDGYEKSSVRLTKNTLYLSASNAEENVGDVMINGRNATMRHDTQVNIGDGNTQNVGLTADEGVKIMADSIIIADKQDNDIDILSLFSDFPRYNASTMYSPGMYVIYKSVMYRCIAGTHGGTFKASEWVQVGLYDLLSSIM